MPIKIVMLQTLMLLVAQAQYRCRRFLLAGQTCVVTVDVIPENGGTFNNETTILASGYFELWFVSPK